MKKARLLITSVLIIALHFILFSQAVPSGENDPADFPYGQGPAAPEAPDLPESPVPPTSPSPVVPSDSDGTIENQGAPEQNGTRTDNGNQSLYRLTDFLNTPILIRQGQGTYQDSGEIEDLIIAIGGEIESYLLDLRRLNGYRSGLYLVRSDAVIVRNGAAQLDLSGNTVELTYIRDTKLIRQFFPDTSVQASRLTDFSVQGRDTGKLGSFEDIVLDTGNNSVSYIVLTTSGILGLGKKYYAVPPSSIDFDPQNETAYVNISPDELDRRQGFDSEYWPIAPESDWTPIQPSVEDSMPQESRPGTGDNNVGDNDLQEED